LARFLRFLECKAGALDSKGMSVMLDSPDREMIVRTLLVNLGYIDWLMVRSHDPDPEAMEVTFYLENPKTKRRAGFVIPKALFQDPRLYPSIKKLLSLALQEPDGIKEQAS
jgi:hypothetical protein